MQMTPSETYIAELHLHPVCPVVTLIYVFFAVISCGALATPANGRKSTFAFTPGTMVKFDCDPGYVLTGERRRWCYDDGDWNWAENGDAACVREYKSH